MTLSMILALAAFSLLGASTPAVHAPNPKPPTGIPMDHTAVAPLIAVAHSDKASYKTGEPVKLFISLKNTTDKPIEVTFSSGQSFDFQAFVAGKTEPVWAWARGRMFTMALRSFTLAPDKSLDFDAEWSDAQAGHYRIESLITVSGGIKARPSFAIDVK